MKAILSKIRHVLHKMESTHARQKYLLPKIAVGWLAEEIAAKGDTVCEIPDSTSAIDRRLQLSEEVYFEKSAIELSLLLRTTVRQKTHDENTQRHQSEKHRVSNRDVIDYRD